LKPFDNACILQYKEGLTLLLREKLQNPLNLKTH